MGKKECGGERKEGGRGTLGKDVGIGEPGRVGQGRSAQEGPNSYRRSRMARPATFKVQLNRCGTCDSRHASAPSNVLSLFDRNA